MRCLIKSGRENPGFYFQSYDSFVPAEEFIWQADLQGMLYPASKAMDKQYVYDIKKEYKTVGSVKSMEDLLIRATCKTGALSLAFFQGFLCQRTDTDHGPNAFAEVTYSRAVPYNYSLLTENTDVVMLEIVERNIPNLIMQAPVMPADPIVLEEKLGANRIGCVGGCGR